MFENSKYDYNISYSEPEYLLTIWKKIFFNKKIVFNSEFEHGRPFSIFIFEDVRFSTYFILINIHASHNKNTLKSIFEPIQQVITANINKISKFNIKRIIICGDFNRDIGSQILDNDIKNNDIKNNDINDIDFRLIINSTIYKFIPFTSNNKTCCNLNGYGYNKNYDQVIDSFDKPILVHPLTKEKWYQAKSSDHIAILAILKNI